MSGDWEFLEEKMDDPPPDTAYYLATYVIRIAKRHFPGPAGGVTFSKQTHKKPPVKARSPRVTGKGWSLT